MDHPLLETGDAHRKSLETKFLDIDFFLQYCLQEETKALPICHSFVELQHQRIVAFLSFFSFVSTVEVCVIQIGVVLDKSLRFQSC